MITVRCSKCGEEKNLQDFYTHSKNYIKGICKECEKKRIRAYQKERPEMVRDNKKRWYNRHKAQINAKVAIYKARVKRKMVDGYGGKCTCCGETRIEFLVADHINNDGARRRKNRDHPHHGHALYMWILKNKLPADFTVLCYNCNNARQFSRACPHAVRNPIFLPEMNGAY